MPANSNWARWIFASVATYLKQVAQEQDLPALVEGLDDRTTEFMEATDRCEIRITGPFTRELSRDWYQIEVIVNVLFLSRYEEEKNKYVALQKIGVFHEAMDGVIAIFKYGNQPGDDEQALVGCLSLIQGRHDAIRVIHFGQVNSTDRIKQSMVDARYRMEVGS